MANQTIFLHFWALAKGGQHAKCLSKRLLVSGVLVISSFHSIFKCFPIKENLNYSIPFFAPLNFHFLHIDELLNLESSILPVLFLPILLCGFSACVRVWGTRTGVGHSGSVNNNNMLSVYRNIGCFCFLKNSLLGCFFFCICNFYWRCQWYCYNGKQQETGKPLCLADDLGSSGKIYDDTKNVSWIIIHMGVFCQIFQQA